MSSPGLSASRKLPHDLRDFPDSLSPMVVKELRQGLRSPMFLAPFIGVHGLAMLAVGVEYAVATGWMGFSVFWLVTWLVLAGLMPLRGFASLREELEDGNALLLMLGGLSRWQIMRGKWLVQIVLSGLTFLSLMPYMLVRYFIGGMEIIPNVLMAFNVMATSAAISACILGASAYRGLPMRFFAAGLGIFWVVLGGIATAVCATALTMMPGKGFDLEMLFFYISAAGVQALYGVMGLQLGRAHLKVYLLPYDTGTPGSVITLMICMPFIMLAAGLVTMGYGVPAVIILITIIFCYYDRQGRTGTTPAGVR